MNDMLVLNITAWARFREVVEYARCQDITISQAVRELVNSGLSHL